MKHLSRRTMLKGFLAGGLVSIGLPPLEIFFDSHGKAYADGTFPRRFGLFFWGNGTLPDLWTPATEGANWEPNESLLPLANLINDVTVVSGMEVKLPNLEAHGTGPAGMLTGQQNSLNGDEHYLAPTIDRLIANAIGGDTAYRSVEAAVEPGFTGLSYNGPASISPAEPDPAALFLRLFGPSFIAPGEDVEPDPKLALRRSVLDAVLDDAATLNKRLGKTDQNRLAEHLESIYDLQSRLLKLETEPPSFEACIRPDDPGTPPDIEGRPDMKGRSKAMSDILAMAFACDLTRVGSIWYTKPVSDVLFPGILEGHHKLTHDEPGDQPQVQQCMKFIMEDLAYFYEALRAIPEGDSNVLQNSIIFATSDNGYARTHQIDEYPILIGGSGGGVLKTGIHYRSASKRSTTDAALTILQAMGLPLTSYGANEAFSDKPLTEIMA